MRLPQMQQGNDQITVLNAFMGVNKNYKIADAEWSDMENMTNDYYPVFANRKKRGLVKTLTKPQGILGGKYLAYVDDDQLYYDEEMVCQLETTGKERQLVSMGALIVVFPDGVIYNTYTEEIDYINNEVETSTNPVFTLCKLDGTSYDAISSNTEPSDKSKYWIDTSKNPVVMKMYDSSRSMWIAVGTTYVKIAATGIGVGFHPYDAADLSGVDKSSAIYNGYDFNTSNVIYDCADDYLIVAGLINKTFTNSKHIKVSRKAPEMDFVCELDNRIWGCSSDNHEIYACKLGDPKNWRFYGGLDSDSYAVTVGTQNVFTGAITYSGTVMFFKEDGYHRIYGTKPSNFECSWKAGRGVQFGSEKSLCIVNEYLFYKARDGICTYAGGTETVSEALGNEPYYDAVAGVYRDKYYVAMRDTNYRYRMYVYDSSKGTWCIEDAVRYLYMAYANMGLYVIDYYNDLKVINNEAIYVKWFPADDIYPNDQIWPGNSMAGNLERIVNWSMTTGDIGMDSPNHKYVKRMDLRLSLDTDAYLKIEVSYDVSEDWVQIMDLYCTKKRSYSIPIPVKRCDTMKMRLSGRGEIRLFSIAKVVEDGSDGHF